MRCCFPARRNSSFVIAVIDTTDSTAETNTAADGIVRKGTMYEERLGTVRNSIAPPSAGHVFGHQTVDKILRSAVNFYKRTRHDNRTAGHRGVCRKRRIENPEPRHPDSTRLRRNGPDRPVCIAGLRGTSTVGNAQISMIPENRTAEFRGVVLNEQLSICTSLYHVDRSTGIGIVADKFRIRNNQIQHRIIRLQEGLIRCAAFAVQPKIS